MRYITVMLILGMLCSCQSVPKDRSEGVRPPVPNTNRFTRVIGNLGKKIIGAQQQTDEIGLLIDQLP